MTHKRLFSCHALLLLLAAWLCVPPSHASATEVPLSFTNSGPQQNNILLTTNEDGSFTLITTGGDPYLSTGELEADLPADVSMLTFDYKVDKSTGSDFEIFFSPIQTGHSINKGGQPASSEWVTAYFDISAARSNWGWGKAGDFLRFDPASGADITMQVRNMRLTTLSEALPEGIETENGILQINSQQDFDLFLQLIQNGFNNLSAKFNTDVTVSGDKTLISRYDGTMDGNGHTLNFDFDYKAEGGSFIKDLYGTMKNFRLEGVVRASAKGFNTLGTWSHGARLENIDNNIEIESTMAGDNTGGGFIGWVQSDAPATVINNCVFRGRIHSEVAVQCAGFVGWSAANSAEFNNCLFIGDIDILINAGDAFGTNAFSRSDNNGTMVNTLNCYYLTNPQYVNDNCTQITQEELASGQVCFQLNGTQSNIGWWQTINTDALPSPLKGERQQVYASGDITCDGKIAGNATFSNTPMAMPEHSHVDGVCENCGHLDENYVSVEDGYYMVGTSAELNYISKFVAASLQNRNINIKLTADIDMSGVEGFMPLNYYGGTFDGQGHTINGLTISLPETECVGLIGIATPGCTLKNLTFGPDCLIEGKAFVGMIGEAAPMAGTVTMTNLINHGTVIAQAQNAGAIIGCGMEGTASLVIRNCGATGTVRGARESAAISGWLGDSPTVTNCWSIASVEGYDDENSTFARPKTATLTNCYSTIGKQGTIISPEDVANGELTWRLNNQSFVNTVWYQTVDTDPTPSTDATHGVVYKTYLDNYGSVQDQESYETFVSTYCADLETYMEEIVANRDTVAEMQEALSALKTAATFEEFKEVFANTFSNLLAKTNASAAAYKAYMDKVEATTTWLDENPDIVCDERDLLENYIHETMEPSDDMPNGSYPYIIDPDNRSLSDAEIKKETARVDTMMMDAIRYGFSMGADVTNLLTNPDFSKGLDGWQGALATGTIVAEGIGSCESWSATNMNMYQTITGLKDGVYELSINGGYRPFNDPQSYQYGAMIYANGNYNYLSTVRETMLLPEEATDLVNCYLTASGDDGATDIEVKDGEGNLLGYAIHGRSSVCYAALGGRAVNRILVNVTDGTLTVGVTNPHSFTTDNEWTGIGNIRLTYLGNMATDEPDLSNTLSGMTERAATILNLYEFADDERYPQYPNFSQDIRDRITAAMEQAEVAATAAEQYACIEELSKLFLEVQECKMAYRNLVTEAEVYMDVAAKASEAGFLDNAEAAKIYELQEEVFTGYSEGTYSTQEAKDMAMLKDLGFAPEADENGYLHLTDHVKFYYFINKVNSGQSNLNAILDTDIMNFTEGHIIYNYAGQFDGNHHSIDVNITRDADNAAIFDNLSAGASVKDLHVTGLITTSAKYAAGVAAHTHNGAVISGVQSSVTINSSIVGDGTHGGLVAVCEEATTIKNCLFDGQMLGSETTCCGGIVGWSSGSPVNIDGCLIVADIQTSAEGSNIISRNAGNAIVSNCYYVTPYGETPNGASQIAPEQLPTGEATYLLNGKRTGNVGWYQDLGKDEMPVLDPTHKKVYLTAEGTYSNEPQSELDKHDGTQEDPYLISTAEELAQLRNYMRTGTYTYVRLEADIDMSGVEAWVPLNTDADKKDGKAWMNWIDFDGQGHVISNFICTTPAQTYNSFFGILCGNVRNVGFENANVSCIRSGAGILGGYIGHDNFAIDGVKQTSIVENVWASGKLSVTQGYAGGMVGNVGGPTIFRNCYANVDIATDLTYSGIFVGRVRDALTLENVYGAGNCTNETGIVGGGKQETTAPSTYKNVVVWSNTSSFFGPTTEDDIMEGISYYDGTNFAELQQTVVAWGKPWHCDMQAGSYPTFDFDGSAIDAIGADKQQNGRVYDINGIRVSKPANGIFIINGKKIVVK